LPPGRQAGVLARPALPFGNRPGSGVALDPERTAGMDQEHLELFAGMAEEEQTGARASSCAAPGSHLTPWLHVVSEMSANMCSMGSRGWGQRGDVMTIVMTD